MSDTVSDLQALADRVDRAGRAGRAGRGVRVARRRDRDPGVRGRGRALRVGPERGHRHPRDPRRPHRLRLRRHARRRRPSPRCSPRPATTSSSAPSTSGPAWPSPTASHVDAAGAVERRARRVRRRDAQDRAGQGARAPDAGAADRRVRVDDANYADAWAEVAVATTTGIRAGGRENGCYVVASHAGRRRRRDPDRVRLQRRPLARRLRPRPRPPARRPTGRPGCSARRSRQPAPRPSCSTRSSRPSSSAIIGSTLNGESVVKGRSLFHDRLGEQSPPARHARRRPDQPAGLHRHRRRRRGPRRPAQRADRRRRAAAVRAHQLLGPPRRHVSTGNAVRGGFTGTPGVGCLALQLAPGDARPGGADRRRRRRRARSRASRACTPASTRSAATSRPAPSGLLITNGALGAPVREFTIASTLQRMLLDVVEVGSDVDWLPMRAAGVSLVSAT